MDRPPDISLATATVCRFQTKLEWLDELSRRWLAAADCAIAARGRFVAALSGGSTPPTLYRHLANLAMDWTKCHLVLGDERTVPHDHPDSNFRMAKEAFGTSPAASRIIPWDTASAPADAARDYRHRLEDLAGVPPRLDLVLLGIGADGHTASLFPGTEALEEKELRAVHNPVPSLGTTRLTLTYPALADSREIWFLLAGADKSEIWDAVAKPGAQFPSSLVKSGGPITVFHSLEK